MAYFVSVTAGVLLTPFIYQVTTQQVKKLGYFGEPPGNRIVLERSYKNMKTGNFVTLLEFAVRATEIGPVEYAVLVARPEQLIDGHFDYGQHTAYFSSARETMCDEPEHMRDGASYLLGDALREEGFTGGTTALPIGVGQSLYVELVSREPIRVIDCLVKAPGDKEFWSFRDGRLDRIREAIEECEPYISPLPARWSGAPIVDPNAPECGADNIGQEWVDTSSDQQITFKCLRTAGGDYEWQYR